MTNLIRKSKENAKRVNNQPEKFDPIVFVNTPISSELKDAIGFDSQIETLKTAIQKGATMIGVVADYGTGKSSMTELLKKSIDKEKNKTKSIKINLWDCENNNNNNNSNPNRVSNLTKSFLYQMANGYDRRFGRFINRILSKNYGNISFAISSSKSLPQFIISALLFGIYQILLQSNTGVMKYLPDYLNVFASVLKILAPLFLILSIIVVVFALKNCCIAFSHWKMNSVRELEISDIFDIYNIIIQRFSPKKGKKIYIFIDDLDRFGDKRAVVEFLKELYRFQDSLGNYKENFIFIVSIKPESELMETKPKEDWIYSKVFDIILSLKPIHFDDYDSILIKLLNCNINEKTKLQKLLGCDDFNIIPESFKWIKKGNNLTLRDLKNRLNQAILILISLKNKNYKVETAVRFEPCAAIAYLESQYPQEYYRLIKNETKFANFMKDSRDIINGGDEKRISSELISAFKKEFSNDPVNNKSEFISDLCEMVKSGVFNYDFRMYFYTYPVGSHIKTTEERVVCDCLLFSNITYDQKDIYNSIDHSYSKEENRVIGDILKTLERFPEIILIHEKLFVHACKLSLDNTLNTFSKYAIVGNDKNFNYWSLIRHVPNNQREKFIEQCVIDINNSLKSQDLLLKKRIEITESLGNDICLFSKLYDGTIRNTPQLSKEEITLIPDPLVAIKLINVDLLNDNQVDYIIPLLVENSLINDGDAFNISLSIMYKFSDIIENESVGNSILQFLFSNQLTDEKLFEYVCKHCNDNKRILEYLNILEITKLSLKYLENIDSLKSTENIKPEIITKLVDNQLYCSPIIYYATQNSLEKLNPYLKEVSTFISACEKISSYTDVIISFRTYCYIQCTLSEYRNLYFDDYPLITTKEYNLIDDTLCAIQMINTLNITEENIDSTISLICSKNYNADELMFLFEYLLCKEANNECISEANLRLDLINRLEYRKLNLKQLTNEQRSKFYSLIENDLKNISVSDKIEYSKKFGCLIPELEIQIQSKCDNDMYYCNMISEIDELSDLTFKWLESNYIPVALSEHLCNQLKLKPHTKRDYIIAQSLRMNKFFYDDSIELSEYTKIYKDVSQIRSLILKDHDFLTKLMNEGELSDVPSDLLEELFVLPQIERMFEYVFSFSDDASKKKYIDKVTHFASETDRESFRKILCSNDNLSLIPNKTACKEFSDRLYPSSPQKKASFVSVWTRYWKNK